MVQFMEAAKRAIATAVIKSIFLHCYFLYVYIRGGVLEDRF